jgi:hypothetical protein
MTSRLAKNRGVSTVDDYMKTNQKWWNEVAQVHAQGDAYLLKEFKAGMNKPYPLDLEPPGIPHPHLPVTAKPVPRPIETAKTVYRPFRYTPKKR